MQLVECHFLVPVRRDANLSDGSGHDLKTWQWLEDRIFEDFGGCTLAPGLYQGFYRDPDSGEKVGDRSRQYTVAISKGQVKRLRDLLREACTWFQQKCIYMSVGGKVEFIRNEDV